MKPQFPWAIAITRVALLLVANVTIAAEPGQRWAVLVGVNDYAELDDLQYCRKDAEALAEQLVQVGFPRENVFLVTDGAADAKNLPTKANIEARIKNVLAVAEQGDLVLVSFSGHGVHIDGKTFLCPTGARIESPENTMIPLATVYGSLERSQATRKLLWVDACRNDPRPAGSRSATDHAKSVAGLVESFKTPPEGILTLASCAADQISWEDDGFGHGVFMHYLLEGLAGKADQAQRGNRDDKISLMELYNYANIKTKRFVLINRDRVQTPELFGRITGDFDIAEVRSELAEDITNSIGMKLKLIPAGEFMMGSRLSEKEVDEKYPGGKVEHYEDEHPRHKVRITRPFYLGIHEVTVGDFKRFVKDSAYKTTAEREGTSWAFQEDGTWEDVEGCNWRNPGFSQTDGHPVTCVSWQDAEAFCKWLSGEEGRTYRLPTEAQWEYACRAGTSTVFSWGNDADDGEGHMNGAGLEGSLNGKSWSVHFGFDDDFRTTSPVGYFKANAFGVYDMHGNVWELCSDRYGEDYYSESAADDPTGPRIGSDRVHRGGGWHSNPRGCRSARRDWNTPDYRLNFLGFRVAQVPAE